jgi:hypothetical protein
MDNSSDSTWNVDPDGPDLWIEAPRHESFRSMESLLEIWLAGARLTEVVHLVMLLAKVELARREITLTWSISQTATPPRGTLPQPP